MKIARAADLEDVAYLVCSTLTSCGITAVLTGGSAATYYAPKAYQSHDLDFVLQFASQDMRCQGAAALKALGYSELGGTYRHPSNRFTLEFPPGPLAIGDDLIKTWETFHKRKLMLHVLTATDCVRDRLLWFYLQPTDRSSLAAAVGVASAQSINLRLIEQWSRRGGFADKLFEFKRLLNKVLKHTEQPIETATIKPRIIDQGEQRARSAAGRMSKTVGAGRQRPVSSRRSRTSACRV